MLSASQLILPTRDSLANSVTDHQAVCETEISRHLSLIALVSKSVQLHTAQ